MKLLILILLFCLTLEEVREFFQNSSITIKPFDNFYLSLNGLNFGDKVNIELTYDTSKECNAIIEYRLSKFCYDSEFFYAFPDLKYNTSKNNNKTTKYYTIYFSGYAKYALFKLSGGALYLLLKIRYVSIMI